MPAPSRIRLAPGCYQFRYRGDNQWYTDYAAFGVEQTPYGLNSVLKVDPPQVPDHNIFEPAPAIGDLESPAFSEPAFETAIDAEVDEAQLELVPA